MVFRIIAILLLLYLVIKVLNYPNLNSEITLNSDLKAPPIITPSSFTKGKIIEENISNNVYQKSKILNKIELKNKKDKIIIFILFIFTTILGIIGLIFKI
ncbi:hypothetical protein [Fusobacterium sp. SYSU M8D902]|uniref:hypothetical protein n=1 Tax=Fusobacterium sp. SYSU M8D902 TaxID=3159562 RepID=UPI0032E4DD50